MTVMSAVEAGDGTAGLLGLLAYETRSLGALLA